MGRTLGRLIAQACLIWLTTGCVALPALQLGTGRDRAPHRTAEDQLAETLTSSDTSANPILRLGMRDLATVLDMLARMEHETPESKAELLSDLERADAVSLRSVVARWQERLTERESRGSESPRNIDSATADGTRGAPHQTNAGDGATGESSSPESFAESTMFRSRFDGFVGSSGSSQRASAYGDGSEKPLLASHDETAETAGDLPTWDELMQALAAFTRERGSGSEPDAALARVHAALLELIWQSGRVDASPDPELWRQLAPAVELALGSSSPPRSPQEIIESLQVATELLRGPGRFQVRGLAFCRRIRGYDNIERLETTTFAADQPLLLYSEVDHFFSEPADSGFHTKLSSTLELLSPGGKSAWRQEFAAVEDVSDAPRRDFFMSHSFRLPANLRPGRYSLRLTLHDELADRTTSGLIALTVR